MSYSVVSIPPFDRQLKRLSKKYASIKRDYNSFLESLEVNPDQGIPLGKNCYKIRLAIKSKTKGKSSGARVVTNVVFLDNTVYLLAIYDKSEKENISDQELEELLQYVPD